MVLKGLSASTTKFARFYVRTTIDPGFEKADDISGLLTASTPAVAYSITETDFEE